VRAMLKLTFDDYEIEIISEDRLTLYTSDNMHVYDFTYDDSRSQETDYLMKYGVFIKKGSSIQKSCLLISGVRGSVSPGKRNALIDVNNLIIILGYSVFCLRMPDLSLIWKVRCEETVTCFEVFDCADGYIVHGELSILKLSKSGEVLWEFFGRDIFTTIDGFDDFQVYDGYVLAVDWLNNKYKIRLSNGKEIVS
jgi:outer membrane protein assembly factor BamB